MNVTSKAINDELSRTIEAPPRGLVTAVVDVVVEGLVGVVSDEVVDVEFVGDEV